VFLVVALNGGFIGSLPSMVIVSGRPFRRMTFFRNRKAASVSRCSVSRKSMGLAIFQGLSTVFLIGCLIAASAMAEEQENSVSLCEGLYKDRWLTPDDLATILSNHRAWLHFDVLPVAEARGFWDQQPSLAEARLTRSPP